MVLSDLRIRPAKESVYVEVVNIHHRRGNELGMFALYQEGGGHHHHELGILHKLSSCLRLISPFRQP